MQMRSLPRTFIGSLAVALGLINAAAQTPAPSAPAPHNTAGTAVNAAHAMVASNSALASAAGVEILKAGGNAVDAAVAVGFAMAVTYPEAGNIGGGGFMIIRMADGRTAALDYREVAPAAATREMFIDSGSVANRASNIGPRASGVPGSVAGLTTAHAEFGKLPLAKVMAPAIRLAEKGFIVDSAFARSIVADSALIGRFSGAKLLMPGGKPLAMGQKLVQPALARTLKAIAAHGARGFYGGEVAKAIADAQQKDGGLITLADLKAYHPAWRDALTGTYRGYTLVSMPPPSSGGVTTIEALNILETFGPLPPMHGTMETHLLAETLRRAFVDRNALLGDPDFSPLPISQLVSKTYARSLAATISKDSATPTADAERQSPAGSATRAPEGVNTTHYSVVDAKGNAVATTTTLNDLYGSGVYVAAAGFFLNDEMDDFATRPGEPNGYGLVQGERNAVAPGKRMLSAMAPTIVLDSANHVVLILGARGGPRIITSVLQVLIGVIDYKLPLLEAMNAGRIHEQARPDSIRYEMGVLEQPVVDSLTAMGHTVVVARFGNDPFIGRVIAIGRTKDGWVGVVDRRSSGGAIGY
jgi:gamma-glutamyltranspeptidase/glutathione hydrolase